MNQAIKETPECGFSRCVPEHPLHCCHTAAAVRVPVRPGVVLAGWRCVFCGKRSRVWTPVKDGPEPLV